MTAPGNDCRIFNQLWIIGAIVSSLAAIPATIWREHASWIMAVAVAVGVAIGLAIEFRRPQAWPYLLKLPAGFRMLRFYNRLLALFVRRKSLLHDPQLELIGVVPIESVTAKPESRVIVLRDEQDHSLTLIDFDRFMARVTSVVGNDLNKACEYSLMTAWRRLEALQQDYPQLEAFFKDPLVIETLKRDIAAHVHIVISKSGEQAAQFFLDEFQRTADVKFYRILPQEERAHPPSASRRRPPKKPAR